MENALIDGLAHWPVRVVGCRWLTKVVTTNPPKYVPHTEYTWACELVGEVPLLVAPVLESRGEHSWSRSARQSAALTVEVRLGFRPFHWNHPDEVLVSLSQAGTSGWSVAQVSIFDPALKHDPRPLLSLDLGESSLLQSGASIRLGTTGPRGLFSAALVVVAQSDTESCRCGRWRLKRRLGTAPPPPFSFLNRGRRAARLPTA